jgi:type IV fimbrial biogenesis protein FimT
MTRMPGHLVERRVGGFTLIELAIVLAVFGLMVAQGLPVIADYLDNGRLRRAASELHHAATIARSEAVRRNARTELQVGAGTWRITDITASPNVTLRSGTLDALASNTELTITFGSNGRTFPAGATGSVDLGLIGKSCSSAIRCPSVRVSSGGSVAICDPSRSSGSFGACS